MAMKRQTVYALLLASSSGAAGYILGVKEKDNQFWNGLPLMRKAMADTSASTLLLQPAAPSIPKGPIEIELKQPAKVRIEEVEIWKRPSRAAEIMRFGYPSFDGLRTFEDFIVCYDRRNRTPHWVMEHLTPERIAYNPDVDKSKCIFQPDISIHPYFQSQNEDYRRSGYDRGHLAAAANHRRSQLSMEQTFLLSNMSPQVGKGFNRDKWNELEKYARHLARENMNIYICSGPLYLPYQEEDGNLYIKYKVIGKSRVAVPTHFFKVILIEKNEGQFELEAYLMPNAAIPDEKPLREFLVPLDSIERAAGFLLFDKLPKQQLKKVNGKMEGGGGFLRLIGG